MLQTAFLTAAGYSLQAAIVILAVILVRLLLRKLGAPTVVSYALWVVVLFRLLCPVSLESPIGVIPEKIAHVPQEYAVADYEYVPPETALLSGPLVFSNMLDGSLDGADFTYASEEYGPNGDGQGKLFPGEALLLTLGILWPVGAALLAGYSVIAWFCLRRKLIGAVPLEGNIRLADHITSPFVMGLFRPKIYLPSGLPEHEREYIILHERHHICRGDHVVKLLAFIALCIHWFNPLVWLAFYLSGRDMEMSCDEAVIQKLGEGIRADYSASLLSLSTGRRILAAMPLAFGEGDTKGRIRNLARWKKPAVWITVLAVFICAAVIVLCATNADDSQQTAAEDGEPGQQMAEDGIEPGQQTEQPEPPPRKYGPDRAYVSEKCLYMAPYLSYFPAGGNSGYRYLMGDGGVYKVNRSNGDKTVLAEGSDWEQWSDLPWSMEEWENLFWPEGSGKVLLSGAAECRYCPLSEREFLLRVDGVLWLVELRGGQQAGRFIHSIYVLVPEGEKGGAQWEFAPMLGSREPWFRFEFDMEYDEVSAVCENGILRNRDGTASTEMDHALQLPQGQAVCWCPAEDGIAAAQKSVISFGLRKGDEPVQLGTIYIQGFKQTQTGRTLYTATLVGTGLVMEQNPDGGAVIRLG